MEIIYMYWQAKLIKNEFAATLRKLINVIN